MWEDTEARELRSGGQGDRRAPERETEDQLARGEHERCAWPEVEAGSEEAECVEIGAQEAAMCVPPRSVALRPLGAQGQLCAPCW